MLIACPYRGPLGIIVLPLLPGLLDIRYIVGLALPFNAGADVDDNTVEQVVSGDVTLC
jgi:hypothetical protein